MSFFSKLKTFDIYPKTYEEFKEKTFSGAAISLVSLSVIIFLVVSELMLWLQVERQDQLYVDTTGEGGKISIYLNISFPKVPCEGLELDMMDVSGEQQLNIDHSIYKTRLDLSGNPISDPIKNEDLKLSDNSEDMDSFDRQLFETKKRYENRGEDYCGSCYGAVSSQYPCCNTCDDVRNAYRLKGWAFNPTENVEQCVHEIIAKKKKISRNEGCNVQGTLLVNKVAGNFHFAPGTSHQNQQSHVHSFMPFEVENWDPSHVIHRLGFGEEYPGLVNPLDGKEKQGADSGKGVYQYFVKVVPTIYESTDNKELETNQYSVTEHYRAGQNMPGVFFMYDLSPIMVHIKETRKSFVHFITSLCAIVGGVFTVAGIVDSIVYNASRFSKKNI
eukprot:gb/GECH01012934.1/.p1 GENE.gb/GECH01012934.1/~~gb/GECH01012934.1/.p1  ORF type:complete len:387 (+),score=85.06 gb/GECH01012934.1/:1-1161(+)